MEEEVNHKRLLLAAALCFLVLLAWPHIFPRPPMKRASTDNAISQTSTSTGTATVAMGRTSSSAVEALTPPARDVKPELYHYQGSVPIPSLKESIPFNIVLTNVGGGIDQFDLPSYKERDRNNRKTDQSITVATPVEGQPTLFGQMAGVEFIEGTTFKMPAKPVYEVLEAKDDVVRYRYVTSEGVEIEREYHLNKESFQIELAVTVRNHSKVDQTERLQMNAGLAMSEAAESGSGFFSSFIPPPDHLNALCHSGNSVERVAYQKLAKSGSKVFKEAVRWGAIDRQYFLGAIIPRDGGDAECRLGAEGRIARSGIALPATTLKPGAEKRHKFTAYLGVKKPELLTKMNADVESAIDYTILGMDLSFLCAALLWVLRLFHGWIGSWGLAILGLTVLVKLILFPLNQRSGRSMRAMSALKPQIDAIRTKHPDDRQRQSEEMLKLYKEHNVNPAGGCLPILIQMPIWFALYRSLWVSIDLFQQSFLWIPDLTARDPFWVLPILLVVVMFLQQRMTPSTMDPAQQKIMQYTMPLVFGLMMMALPAGLCFYILVNTLLTIVQQHFINRSIGPIGGPPSVQGATA
jgi:YidC/Oxa1 family membrane protein insertase